MDTYHNTYIHIHNPNNCPFINVYIMHLLLFILSLSLSILIFCCCFSFSSPVKILCILHSQFSFLFPLFCHCHCVIRLSFTSISIIFYFRNCICFHFHSRLRTITIAYSHHISNCEIAKSKQFIRQMHGNHLRIFFFYFRCNAFHWLCAFLFNFFLLLCHHLCTHTLSY